MHGARRQHQLPITQPEVRLRAGLNVQAISTGTVQLVSNVPRIPIAAMNPVNLTAIQLTTPASSVWLMATVQRDICAVIIHVFSVVILLQPLLTVAGLIQKGITGQQIVQGQVV